jgi:5'-3' exonuclease
MRLHLVDGTYELFRAHFSKRPSFRSPDGRDLKGAVGVVASLIGLLHEATESVTHIGVAFDNPIRSFRNDLFAGYKTEAGVPEDLLAQFDPVEQGVAALGVRVWSMRDHEADDALASGAARFRDEVEQVRILTPDKDLGQCLRPNVMQIDRMRSRLIDEAELLKSKGVRPASIPDFLALTGDSADGIPGIPGWGAVSAATVLNAYSHIEQIPEDVRAWTVRPRGAERLAAALNAQRDDAILYRKLATLVEDLPIAKSLDDVAFHGVPREKFLAWCEGVGAKDLPSRITRWS